MTGTIGRMRFLLAAALAICAVVAAPAGLAACGGSDDKTDASAAARPPDRFDAAAAFELLKDQVELGPRPAGSDASRKLADRLRKLLPDGRFQKVPGGLRNVVGRVKGRDPDRFVVVGAHYDTKDAPSFVGANDGASGTAVAVELARTIKPRTIGPTLVFVLFDGEESPADTSDADFVDKGLRGSRVAARAYRDAEAMILLDFVGDKNLVIPREINSDPELWKQLRAAARSAGKGKYFPAARQPGIADDHIPFLERGVPSIDLIDFDFDCFHQTCDDLSAVSERSLDATGESVLELLRKL